MDEIVHWHETCGVRDFAFYDDALLVDAEAIPCPCWRGLSAGIDVRFHTPNALHVRAITRPMARLMFQAGFHTIRLGLETTSFERRQTLDRKLTEAEFIGTVEHLKAAGFGAGQVGAYLLVGLPGQDLASVEDSIAVVKQAGVTPVIAHYTPIPHTPMWPAAVAVVALRPGVGPDFYQQRHLPLSERDLCVGSALAAEASG